MQKHSNKQEMIVYTVLWVALFVAPLLSTYIQSAHDSTVSFSWHGVFFVWRQMAFFFLAFLLHNFLLAPLLVYRHRHVLYFSSIVLLLAAFVAVQCVSKPDLPRRQHVGKHIDRPHGRYKPHRHDARGERSLPADTAAFSPHGAFVDRPHDRPMEEKGHRPPVIFGEHDAIATIILVLMLGMNIGVKLYFKQRTDRVELAEMERRNLQQQLEFLKYQINPHFMMNTLNNIHALIDIDPEEAKETIVELSKIMRFVLYEGSKQVVPLSRELVFLENYVRLMWKRVTDQVDISLDLPTQIPEYDVPPLLLITFVENAFKHGVSYQQESFINISVKVEDDRLLFLCRNSKVARPMDAKTTGGVGLANACRRLQLLYGEDYTLDIHDDDTTYSVALAIPLKNDLYAKQAE